MPGRRRRRICTEPGQGGEDLTGRAGIGARANAAARGRERKARARRLGETRMRTRTRLRDELLNKEIESLTGLRFQDLKDSSVKTWRKDTSVET